MASISSPSVSNPLTSPKVSPPGVVKSPRTLCLFFGVPVASAVSRDLFCNDLLKMLNILAVEIGADTADELGFAQEGPRFDHGPLGVNPVRFDSIQPGTLDRQLTDDDPHATCPLGLPVMRPNPAADFL